jgi:hypothetical protein
MKVRSLVQFMRGRRVSLSTLTIANSQCRLPDHRSAFVARWTGTLPVLRHTNVSISSPQPRFASTHLEIVRQRISHAAAIEEWSRGVSISTVDTAIGSYTLPLSPILIGGLALLLARWQANTVLVEQILVALGAAGVEFAAFAAGRHAHELIVGTALELLLRLLASHGREDGLAEGTGVTSVTGVARTVGLGVGDGVGGEGRWGLARSMRPVQTTGRLARGSAGVFGGTRTCYG